MNATAVHKLSNFVKELEFGTIDIKCDEVANCGSGLRLTKGPLRQGRPNAPSCLRRKEGYASVAGRQQL